MHIYWKINREMQRYTWRERERDRDKEIDGEIGSE